MELEKLVEVNIIERSVPPYASPLVVVRRKKVGKVISKCPFNKSNHYE